MIHANAFTIPKTIYSSGAAVFIYMSIFMALIFVPFSMFIF